MSTRDKHPIPPTRRPEDRDTNTPQDQKPGQSNGGRNDTGSTSKPEWTDRWDDVSTNLRNLHNGLTDADLAYTKGREKDLYQRVGTRLGKTEQEARELVERAARNQPHNPQDRSLLKDQRDRTTGADQATRDDMAHGDERPDAGRITNSEEQKRRTNTPDTGRGTDTDATKRN